MYVKLMIETLERSWQISCKKKAAIKIKLKNDLRSNEKIKSLSFGKYIWLSYFLTS